MGKYKQWLHHQEIGRRLRDQISTLEHERARVQQMAPAQAMSLPETDNPIIAALSSYTRAGNKLSTVDVIKAAMPDIGPDPIHGAAATPPAARPAGAPAAGGPSARSAASAAAAGDVVVASLINRAEHLPSDPLKQMQDLSRAHEGASPAAPPPGAAADSVNGWWQRHRQDGDD